MGAVEHLKTLCCLGLKPESAMVAVTPVLHEIIPHGWSRMGFFEPDATITSSYAENPAMALYRERFLELLNDPSNIIGSLYRPLLEAVGIGWSLHRQGQGWLESDWYREIEAPLDSCWCLDAMIGDGGRTIATVHLTRPRSARPFTVDDVQRLDRLRPWLAHAFRRSSSHNARQGDEAPISTLGAPVRNGLVILTADAKLVYQTASLESLRTILTGEPLYCTRYVPARDRLPSPILKLLRQITGAANGTSNTPPRIRISTAYGVLTLEAKWLVPPATLPADAARDPKSCLISVTIELHEHPIAHAARVLRESGATPAQVKVGIHLALGKPKSLIADELGIQLSSVLDMTKKLYQTLDVHNSAGLGTRIWLDQNQVAARQYLRRAG
jgi:hypothetical protein